MTADSRQFPLLAAVDSPADLRALDADRLPALADELRAYLVRSLSHGGCHFAANLGTVELAIALHYVYDTPTDRLVWDVGHQAYPHKILTGRRDALSTIRQRGGLAPFPTRDESEYDTLAAQLGLDPSTAAVVEGWRPYATAVVYAASAPSVVWAGKKRRSACRPSSNRTIQDTSVSWWRSRKIGATSASLTARPASAQATCTCC